MMSGAGDATSAPPLVSQPVVVTEYDISRPVGQLRLLRVIEFILILGGLGNAPSIVWLDVVTIGLDKVPGGPFEVVPWLALTLFGIMALADSGVLRPGIWRRYRIVLPLVVLVAIWAAVDAALWLGRLDDYFLRSGQRGTITEQQSMGSFVMLLEGAAVLAIIAAIGSVTVTRLLRAKLLPTTHRVAELIDRLETARRSQTRPRARGQPVDRERGLVYGALALVLLYVPLGPISAIPFSYVVTSLGGTFLLLKARRYFQVSADSLLAADQRPAILFLRSFADDGSTKVVPIGPEQARLFDFSIETRLANHFMRFGPFIAVGSPLDTVPRPGAARVRLSDDQWQQAVTGWIGSSSVIVMYAGATQWVDWELGQVIASGNTRKLIVLFALPPPSTGRERRRIKTYTRETLRSRLERLTNGFAFTPWQAALQAVGTGTFDTVIALRFDPAGGVTLIRSKRRTKDAFQLAAEIAHLAMLGELATVEP